MRMWCAFADWLPMLTWSRGYGRRALTSDLSAAAVVTLLIMVGFIVLPRVLDWAAQGLAVVGSLLDFGSFART